MGRPVAQIELSTEERERLEAWSRRRKTSQALAERARIVLLSAEGHSNDVIAEKLRLNRVT